MTYADRAFKDTARRILNEGVSDKDQAVRPRWEDGSPANTLSVFGVVTEYDLEKEFPALTLRRTALKSAIDEILWIWQKKSNKVADLKSHIWDSWANDEGTIGEAYGAQLAKKHKYSEGEFDQVDRVLYDLKNNPTSRRILTNIYNHDDLHKMELYPCAYSMTFSVKDGKLNGMLNQRSQDFLTANNWNVVQYAVLLHMFAQVSGLKVGKLIHVIADCHIYERHIPIVEELLLQPEGTGPALTLNKDIKNFYDFEMKDFIFTGYEPSDKKFNIEVAV